MNKLLIVAGGGALGAVARYWLGGVIHSLIDTPFPLGTFVINISGSFLIGFILALTGEQMGVNAQWRLLLATGFLGAYTTFSTFEYETLKLLEKGSFSNAALNVLLSVALGLLAVWLGAAAARIFIPTTRGEL